MLTDPELDLLRELLEDDPANEVAFTVATELSRRARWSEVGLVLAAALPASPGRRVGWELLGRAVGASAARWREADREVVRVGVAAAASKAGASPYAALISEIRAGLLTSEAPPVAVAVRPVVSDVAPVGAAAPQPVASSWHGDPWMTPARAEAYAAAGRHDRALRWYRRMAHLRPADAALRARWMALQEGPARLASSVAAAPQVSPPPDLRMPSPYSAESADFAGAGDEAPTDPTLENPAQGASAGSPLREHEVERRPTDPAEHADRADPDTEEVVIGAAAGLDDAKSAPRRRSLIVRK